MAGSATVTIVTSSSSMNVPIQIAAKGHHLRIRSPSPPTAPKRRPRRPP